MIVIFREDDIDFRSSSNIFRKTPFVESGAGMEANLIAILLIYADGNGKALCWRQRVG